MFNSSLTFDFYSIFISIQKVLNHLNQCYITPIRQIFRAWLGAWGWFSFEQWLTAKGRFAASWRIHFFWHLIRLWIFPCKRLRTELIILNEYWFTKTKLALACPRKVSLFIIRTDNLQQNSFSFLNNYLPTIYINTYDLVLYLVLGWWLLRGVADRVILSLFSVESLSWVPLSVSTYSSIKDLLWLAFSCTRKVCLVFENLNYYLDNL